MTLLTDASVVLVCCRSIEKYVAASTEFNGVALLQSVGEFIVVFVGAFTLGSAMGCTTALVSLFGF